MKIITWNVNGIRAWHKKGMWGFVERERPDIFCVQETKAHKEQVPDDIVNPNNYLSYWNSAEKKGYSGVATFLRTKPISQSDGIGVEQFDREGRVIRTDHGAFVLLNIYFPNGGASIERHNFKQEFLRELMKYTSALVKEGREVVLVGDYNVAPEDIDVYDPKALAGESGFLPEERAWFREFLKSGFVDTYRHIYPQEKQVFTWWSMLERGRISNRGWRIDHICITKGLIGKLKSVEIYQDQQGSDHCPVGIELEV